MHRHWKSGGEFVKVLQHQIQFTFARTSSFFCVFNQKYTLLRQRKTLIKRGFCVSKSFHSFPFYTVCNLLNFPTFIFRQKSFSLRLYYTQSVK